MDFFLGKIFFWNENNDEKPLYWFFTWSSDWRRHFHVFLQHLRKRRSSFNTERDTSHFSKFTSIFALTLPKHNIFQTVQMPQTIHTTSKNLCRKNPGLHWYRHHQLFQLWWSLVKDSPTLRFDNEYVAQKRAQECLRRLLRILCAILSPYLPCWGVFLHLLACLRIVHFGCLPYPQESALHLFPFRRLLQG